MAAKAEATSEITTETMGSESCGPMEEKQRQATAPLNCQRFTVKKSAAPISNVS
jgi:hypothetical protein